MIYIDSIDSVSDLIRNRAAKMWCRTKRQGHKVIAYVTPYGREFKHKEKHRRQIEIDLLERTADCFSREDGEPCQANADYVLETGQPKTPRVCSHVYRALQQIAANERRKAA